MIQYGNSYTDLFFVTREDVAQDVTHIQKISVREELKKVLLGIQGNIMVYQCIMQMTFSWLALSSQYITRLQFGYNFCPLFSL